MSRSLKFYLGGSSAFCTPFSVALAASFESFFTFLPVFCPASPVAFPVFCAASALSFLAFFASFRETFAVGLAASLAAWYCANSAVVPRQRTRVSYKRKYFEFMGSLQVCRFGLVAEIAAEYPMGETARQRAKLTGAAQR